MFSFRLDYQDPDSKKGIKKLHLKHLQVQVNVIAAKQEA